MSNSLANLLARMRAGSVVLGWGAVAAFGRAQLNRLLEEQYLSWLSDSRFIPPMSGYLYVTPDHTESVQLDSLLLGKPVLSFASASLHRSRVTVTMNLIGGTYTAMSYPVTGVPALMSSFSITEDMGYRIEMQIELGHIEGEVDKRGRVTLDLASDPNLKCNLGELPGVQNKIAEFIQGFLAAQPDDRRMFELGLFDFSGYNPLSPTGFYIRTQKAPGSGDSADGAVLVFIRLKARDENGQGLPTEGSNFPYLIPDDTNGANQPLYSAALVLNQQWLELVDETQLDVLKNLLFPGENIFVETPGGRHRPADMLILGNVKAATEHVAVEPAFVNMKGSKVQQFTARKSDGSVVRASWSVSNLISPLAVGTITANGGLYTSPAASRLGKERQPVLVTASYTQDGRQQTRSAMVLGVYENMSISPRVCTSGVGSTVDKIPLRVTTVTGGELIWPTLLPTQGTLTRIDNNRALYTPPVTQAEPLQLVRLTVQDRSSNESIEATIVVVKFAQTLQVDPPYVSEISQSELVYLRAEDYQKEDCQWSVIGEGEVNEDGVFTPPAFGASRISVVRCDIQYDGVGPIRRRGFSIIQLTERAEPELRWSELQNFDVSINGDDNRCYANGRQQVPVVVKIETKPVRIDGRDHYVPVSDADLATLKLVHKLTGAEVPFITLGEEGIEHNSPLKWAANKQRNRFRYFPTMAQQAPAVVLPKPDNNGTRYRELYIHMAVEGNQTFFARFQGNGATFSSGGVAAGEVSVRGVFSAAPSEAEYQLDRERVAQDPNGHDEPNDPSNPNRDVFSYYLWSTDYWRLSYRRLGSYPVRFSTLHIEKNISTIQWESELLDETFFSYTCHAFNPANGVNSDSPAPEGLSFDLYLRNLFKETGKVLSGAFEGGSKPSPGQLLISLHRTHDMKFWYDGMAGGDVYRLYRKLLDPAVIFVLLDEDGNRHRLQIGFAPPSTADSRNRLVLLPQ